MERERERLANIDLCYKGKKNKLTDRHTYGQTEDRQKTDRRQTVTDRQ